MIDKLKLSFFLKDEYLIKTNDQFFLNYELLGIWGFKVSAGSVFYEEVFTDGNLSYKKDITREQSPWDKIKSSYSGLAIKWWNSNYMTSVPRLEIKASPAKLMQGHNVFGSTNINDCAKFMTKLLMDAFPDIIEAIDWQKTSLDLMDMTFSTHFPVEHHKNFIAFMRNISSGQMRKSSRSEEFETTCYWGLGSKRKTLKAYLKRTEMGNEISKLEKLFQKNPFDNAVRRHYAIMTYPKLLEHAENLVRFEATIKKDWMRDNNMPYYLTDWIKYQKEYEQDGKNLIVDLWKKCFRELFDSLSGEGFRMDNHNDVLTELKKVYFRETKNGLTYSKANRIFDFYKLIVNEGYYKVYETYKQNNNKATFGRYLNDLLNATNLSKAILQNLTTASHTNIVPFIKLIEINFDHQVPEWANELKMVSGSDLVANLNHRSSTLTMKQENIIHDAFKNLKP